MTRDRDAILDELEDCYEMLAARCGESLAEIEAAAAVHCACHDRWGDAQAKADLAARIDPANWADFARVLRQLREELATWKGLVQVVRELAQAAARTDLAPLLEQAAEPRVAAALLAMRHFGSEVAGKIAPAVNVAALALAFRGRLTAHMIRPAASRLVHETDLHSLPGAPPRLLCGPWIAEMRRPETGERLFGATAALAGYQLGEDHFLVGLDWPDGALVVRWRPRWEGGEIAAGLDTRSSTLIADVDRHRAWAREAARYAVVLGLLLDAEGVPLRLETERPTSPRRERASGGRQGDRTAPQWTLRHVYLDEVAGTLSGAGAADRDPGLPEEVLVRGHLRRQHRGPGGREIAWIYVASYEARRWVAPRPVKVVVGARGPQEERP